MQFTITENETDQRFDRFLRKYFKQYPEVKLSDIFSWIRKWAIKVNGRRRPENRRIQKGDKITRDDNIVTEKQADNFKKSKKLKLKAYPLEKIKKMIIYEDTHRLVFNKPADIVMHGGTGHTNDICLDDILKIYIKKGNENWELRTEKKVNIQDPSLRSSLWAPSSTFSPSFCFRLDRDTSWIVIAAKTYQALQYLNQQIRERKTEKTYFAVVAGKFPSTKTIESPLFKGFDKASGKAKVFVNHEQGQSAKTTAHLLKWYQHPQIGDISLVQVKIYTGRMHQIRVHLSSIGFPIIWDLMYGIPAINRIAGKQAHITRQLLHSAKYWFFDIFVHTHLEFHAENPKIFDDLFQNISWKK